MDLILLSFSFVAGMQAFFAPFIPWVEILTGGLLLFLGTATLSEYYLPGIIKYV